MSLEPEVMEQELSKMTISVIVPTWNEEQWLPRLLRSLTSVKNIHEIIVADNKSVDKTAFIAKACGCKVINGGKPGEARNAGAKVARGDILLFIDADVIINPEVVGQVIRHFTMPEIVAVHVRLSPLAPSFFTALCFRVMDYYFEVLSRVGLAQGIGPFMAIRKDAFFRVQGFMEQLAVGEDLDMFRRLKSIGQVRYERSVAVHVSARRFAIENPLFYAMKCVLWAFLRLIGTKASIFPYNWAPYPAAVSEREGLPVHQLLI